MNIYRQMFRTLSSERRTSFRGVADVVFGVARITKDIAAGAWSSMMPAWRPAPPASVRRACAPQPGATMEGGTQIVCRRHLMPRQPRVLPIRSRQTIVCESGTVWVTQGDSQDYVLTPGQKVTLAPTDAVLITAMAGPARIHCRAPADEPPQSDRAAAAMDADRAIARPESSAWQRPEQPPHPYLKTASCGSLK